MGARRRAHPSRRPAPAAARDRRRRAGARSGSPGRRCSPARAARPAGRRSRSPRRRPPARGARASRTISRTKAASSSASRQAVDELLGDLEDVEREVAHVAQGRVARAEVVEREPHAERAEPAEGAAAASRVVASRSVSVISSVSRSAGRPVAASVSATLAMQVRVLELAGARLTWTVIGSPPGGRPGDAPAGTPPAARRARRRDQPGLLGQRDELHGRDPAALGVLPAHERLDGDEPALGEVDDRLVLDDQLAVLDRRFELVAQRVPAQHRVAHRAA